MTINTRRRSATSGTSSDELPAPVYPRGAIIGRNPDDHSRQYYGAAVDFANQFKVPRNGFYVWNVDTDRVDTGLAFSLTVRPDQVPPKALRTYVAGIGDNVHGGFQLGYVQLVPVAVADLPTEAEKGCLAAVDDGTAALAWGATVTDGGSTYYLVTYNGTNWTVAGK